jgi:electron transfer flavoprotein beta subunit
VNIIVCVKRVPDTETRIRVGGDGVSIDPSGVKYVVSPYDEFAVEAALRLKDGGTATGEVVTLSLGDEAGQDVLRTTLAMGADRAILLKGEVTPDGLATAKALAAEIEGVDAPLVLLGVKAADDDQQQVGPMLAGLLGRPCATAVSSFEVDGSMVRCRREVEGGTEVVELPLPAVLTITKGAYEPRYASLKGIMAAKRKPLDVKDAAAAPSRIRVEVLELPPERGAGRIVGEGPDAVPELVRILREEANAL